jgi:hypothetical protein
VCHELYSRTLS